jgi:tetratricopeptide (TPR) repeat protein
LRVSVVTTVVIAGVLFLPYLVTPFLASQNLVAGNELIESDIEKARSAYRAAAELDPLLAEAHAGLARAAFLQGRVNEAVHHQQDALRLDRLNQKYLRDLDRYQSGAESNVS